MPIVLTPNSSGIDLIDTARAIQNSTLAALNSSNPAYLATLVTAASRSIQNECNRTFAVNSYSEYYSGANKPYDLLLLANYPVLSIDRLAVAAVDALLVSNSNQSLNQRATVASDANGLTLVRVASAVKTTNTLAYATYTTLAQLAAAINALGNGWSATVAGGYELFASADLKVLSGAVDARAGNAVIQLFTENVLGWSSMGWDGWAMVGAGPGWRLEAESGRLSGLFPQGSQNIRVDYTAGFATIPEDLQYATESLVQLMYQRSQINSAVQSENLGPYSYSLSQLRALYTPDIRRIVDKYTDRAKMLVSY